MNRQRLSLRQTEIHAIVSAESNFIFGIQWHENESSSEPVWAPEKVSLRPMPFFFV
jgi:hypothetical protein